MVIFVRSRDSSNKINILGLIYVDMIYQPFPVKLKGHFLCLASIFITPKELNSNRSISHSRLLALEKKTTLELCTKIAKKPVQRMFGLEHVRIKTTKQIARNNFLFFFCKTISPSIVTSSSRMHKLFDNNAVDSDYGLFRCFYTVILHVCLLSLVCTMSHRKIDEVFSFRFCTADLLLCIYKYFFNDCIKSNFENFETGLCQYLWTDFPLLGLIWISQSAFRL